MQTPLRWPAVDEEIASGSLPCNVHIPNGAYATGVALLYNRDPDFWVSGKGKVIMLDFVGGPALQWLWLILWVMWPTTLLLSLVAYYLAECTESGDATYPNGMWVAFAVQMAFFVYAEMKVSQYLVIPAALLDAIKLPMMGATTYAKWLFGRIAMSILTAAGIFAHGLLTATAVKAELVCSSSNGMLSAWEELMGASMFGLVIPRAWWAHVLSPAALVSLLFTIQFAVQFVTPLFMTRPVKDIGQRIPDFSKVESPEVLSEDTRPFWISLKDKWNGGYTLISAALVEVANGCGMCTVSALSISRPLARMQFERHANKHGLTLWWMVKPRDGVMAMAIRESMGNTLLRQLVWLNLQASLFILHEHLAMKSTHRHFNWQGALPIILSLINSSINELDILRTCLLAARDVLLAIPPSTEFRSKWAGVDVVYEDLKYSMFKLISIGATCFFAAGYAVLKLVAAQFCPSGLWNLAGCVSDV